jgi:hypothetical protein
MSIRFGFAKRAIEEGDKFNEKAVIRAMVALNTSARTTARPVRS